MYNSENLTPDNVFIEPSEKRYLKDILKVGSDKPLGYLPYDNLPDEFKVDKESVIKYLLETGRKVLDFQDTETWVSGGAIFVYDEKSLQKLLNGQEIILKKNNWPISTEDFVKRVANEIVDRKKNFELFSLIALCFNDYENIIRGIFDVVGVFKIIKRKLSDILQGKS